MNKIATINYQGKDYATVPARLMVFRQENPRASIETEHTFNPDDSVSFKATIIKDRSDEYSATATGTARYTATEISKAKAFEKLETISIGRALAVLGYLNNGDVATTEEMNEFEASKREKYAEQIETATDVKELMALFTKMTPLEKKEFQPVLAERKKALTEKAA